MLDFKKYKEEDPLKRLVEKDSGGPELSPMEPPEIADESTQPENIEKYHDYLKQLIKEHKEFSEKLSEFEKAIIFFKENGLQKQDKIKETINNFFAYIDNKVLPHNRQEEKTLFPLLNARLIEEEQYTDKDRSSTVVDIMEDDHSKLIQLSALAFNLLGLALRLPDMNSRLIVLDLAIEQSMALIELLRLHMYREDHIVFDLAQQHMTENELTKIKQQLPKIDSPA
jgi:hemerythrin-like domain-containing protein